VEEQQHAGVPLRRVRAVEELGDVSLHPQGRPAGGRLRRPSSADRPSACKPQPLGRPSKPVKYGNSRSRGADMGIVPRQRLVPTGVAALLVISAVFAISNLAHSNRPSDRRCADLWNGPTNQTNRSLVRGRVFPLATVRGAGPNKAGEQECAVLLRERKDRPWLLAGASWSPAARWCGVPSPQASGTEATALPAASTTLSTRRCRRTGPSHSTTASRMELPRPR
jgi:hypothetical protein